MNTEYAELLSELRELNQTLKQIEQNTQNNGKGTDRNADEHEQYEFWR